MKFIFTIFTLILIQNLGFGQDTLVFRNGNVLPVLILDVSKTQGTIKYEKESKISIVAFHHIERYKKADEWIVLDTINRNLNYPIAPQKLLRDIEIAKNSTGWTVGTNLTSLLFGINKKDNYFITHSIRPLLTIEPEYKFKNQKVSLHATFGFGLPYPKVNTEPKTKMQGWETYNQVAYYFWTVDEFNNLKLGSVTQYDRYKKRYIPFQGGLSIKFWPSKSLSNRFFLQVGIVAGIADYHAITVYDRFITNTGSGYPSASIVSQQFLVEKDPYFFIKPELGIGYVFHLTKSFQLSTELTYLRAPENNGSKKDIVYMSLDNADYVKVFEGRYNDWDNQRNFWPWWHIRIKFSYNIKINAREE